MRSKIARMRRARRDRRRGRVMKEEERWRKRWRAKVRDLKILNVSVDRWLMRKSSERKNCTGSSISR
jgi:hypothetical protein